MRLAVPLTGSGGGSCVGVSCHTAGRSKDFVQYSPINISFLTKEDV